jgi:ParB family chromosome partitioning protein
MQELEIRSLKENELIIEKGLNTFYEVGNALTEIRDNRLYKELYPTFEQYCKERWGISRDYSYRMIRSSSVIANIKNVDNCLQNEIPKTEGQARELSKAPPEKQAEVWHQAQEETGKNQPTAKEIKQVIENRAHVSNNSGNNEWYTPSDYIESARSVLIDIDLDPASSETANKTVQAKTYFTENESGLDKEWRGRVWMNPPYAQPLIKEFTDKLCLCIDNRSVTEAIVLVNNATETVWFQSMLRRSSAVCFPEKRIKFVDPLGNPSGAPLQGQAILYFGENGSTFKEIFSFHGAVLSNGF